MTPPVAELFQSLRIAPSILAADFSKLGSHVAEVMDAEIGRAHV